MITPQYAVTMARYNHWQNSNLLSSASTLGPDELTRDLGAFFGSIQNTCFHLFWGDNLWLNRFDDSVPPPTQTSITDSVRECDSWKTYRTRRGELDQAIINWANTVSQAQLDTDLTYYSVSVGRDFTKPLNEIVTHFFNHQTHHRGQIHAMLTSLGASTADTDLPLMPE